VGEWVWVAVDLVVLGDDGVGSNLIRVWDLSGWQMSGGDVWVIVGVRLGEISDILG
jgi:hypothetical protein